MAGPFTYDWDNTNHRFVSTDSVTYLFPTNTANRWWIGTGDRPDLLEGQAVWVVFRPVGDGAIDAAYINNQISNAHTYPTETTTLIVGTSAGWYIDGSLVRDPQIECNYVVVIDPNSDEEPETVPYADLELTLSNSGCVPTATWYAPEGDYLWSGSGEFYYTYEERTFIAPEGMAAEWGFLNEPEDMYDPYLGEAAIVFRPASEDPIDDNYIMSAIWWMTWGGGTVPNTEFTEGIEYAYSIVQYTADGERSGPPWPDLEMDFAPEGVTMIGLDGGGGPTTHTEEVHLSAEATLGGPLDENGEPGELIVWAVGNLVVPSPRAFGRGR